MHPDEYAATVMTAEVSGDSVEALRLLMEGIESYSEPNEPTVGHEEMLTGFWQLAERMLELAATSLGEPQLAVLQRFTPTHD